MAQGTRGRWVRVAATGFAVLVGTGLVGCMNTDKDKKDKLAKQPTQGLPGTPRLGADGNAVGKAPAPATQFNTGTGIQQTGFNQPRTTGTPTGNFPPGYNTNDFNRPTNAQPGGQSTIGAPGVPGAFNPGVSVQPNSVAPYPPLGMNPPVSNTTVASASQFNPPSSLGPLPPLPPDQITPASGAQFASGPVQPPQPIAPVQPSVSSFSKGLNN